MRRSILAVSAVCVLAILLFFVMALKARNRTILRNSSGKDITDVHLLVQSLDDADEASAEAARIATGETLVIRHGMNDSRISLTFRLAESPRDYNEPYVELRTGEAWLMEVFPDGSVRSVRHTPKE